MKDNLYYPFSFTFNVEVTNFGVDTEAGRKNGFAPCHGYGACDVTNGGMDEMRT